MTNSYSLYRIENPESSTFPAYDYSWFKFGDLDIAEKFAVQLFSGFIDLYGPTLLLQDEIIIFPSPYFAIPTASNFLCHFFKNELNKFLYSNSRNACKESKILRNQTYVQDYGALDFTERLELISNDTYYIDKTSIDHKFCIFVDDIKITGSHELTVKKILEGSEALGEFHFIYFAELVNKNVHPNIENHYNYFAVKGTEEIITLINNRCFHFNTRIVKYILALGQDQFLCVLESISAGKCKELFDLAISNNYHNIKEYKSSIDLLYRINEFIKQEQTLS